METALSLSGHGSGGNVVKFVNTVPQLFYVPLPME
jgi:hypothetical protein